jgi:hypothetical protein
MSVVDRTSSSLKEIDVAYGSSTGLEARKPDVRFIRTSRHCCNPITNWSRTSTDWPDGQITEFPVQSRIFAPGPLAYPAKRPPDAALSLTADIKRQARHVR